jgi:hypothetical protein
LSREQTSRKPHLCDEKWIYKMSHRLVMPLYPTLPERKGPRCQLG